MRKFLERASKHPGDPPIRPRQEAPHESGATAATGAMIRFLGFLFSAGSIAAIAGVAVVGAVLWIYDRDLPDYKELKTYQPATLSRVYSGEGEVIAEFAEQRRIFTPIDEIPPLVKNAFISAEDKNFYVHSGVDGLGIVKAMLDNFRRIQTGERLRGASTITQQVIKNFL